MDTPTQEVPPPRAIDTPDLLTAALDNVAAHVAAAHGYIPAVADDQTRLTLGHLADAIKHLGMAAAVLGVEVLALHEEA